MEGEPTTSVYLGNLAPSVTRRHLYEIGIQVGDGRRSGEEGGHQPSVKPRLALIAAKWRACFCSHLSQAGPVVSVSLPQDTTVNKGAVNKVRRQVLHLLRRCTTAAVHTTDRCSLQQQFHF